MVLLLFILSSAIDASPTKDANCSQVIEYLDAPKEKETSSLGLNADDLNVYGMRCYKEERHIDAARLFSDAISSDPNHVLANYNLACVLAKLFATQGPCDMDFDWLDSWKYLQSSIDLDPKRRERAKVDSDFQSFHGFIDFRTILFGTPKNPSDMANIFDGAFLWGDTPGAQTMAEVQFTRTNPSSLTGTVKGWMLGSEFEDGEPLPPKSTRTSKIEVQGTWRATESAIIVDWSANSNKKKMGNFLVADGKGWTETISLKTMNHHGYGGWFTLPGYCGA